MSATIAFPTPITREQDLRALQEILPSAVAAAVEQVGATGFAAFFDGYKESIDLQKKAA